MLNLHKKWIKDGASSTSAGTNLTSGIVGGGRPLEKYRADKHIPWSRPYDSIFHPKLAVILVNGKRYRHCTVIICVR